MSSPSRPRRLTLAALVFTALLLGSARTATPAEVGAFVSGGGPGELWGTGYGGTLTITLFNIVGGEIEGAWQGSDLPSTSLLTLSAKAYVGPSFGRFVPYGGIGAGVYRESLPGSSDTGTLGLVFVGTRFKFPFGLILRGEYQWVDLPLAAPLDMDRRYVFGLGLGF